MLTSVERVKQMGAELAVMTDEKLTMLIEDASLEVSSLQVPEQHQERFTRYLAAHLATVNIRKVVREKVDVIERQYSDNANVVGFHSTPYGQEFQRLLDSLKKKSINLTVL